jgi:prefoldin beta subunit
MTEKQNLIQEFEKGRAQLMNVSSQKQQFSFQKESLEVVLKELNKPKEKKVLKSFGAVLISADKEEVITDLKKQKESTELKLKTIEKQEEILMNKLNKLKTEIEENQKEK